MKKSFIQLHIAVFLAGFTGILGRLITLNEGLLVAYRLLFTAATMWLLFSWQKKLQRIPWSMILKLAGVGVISTLHWVTFFGAIKYSNVSVALVCFSSLGFFTAIFEPLITRTSLNWSELLLGVVVMSGIYIIFHFDSGYKVGIVISLISAVLASIFPVLNRQLLRQINVETLLTYQLTSGLIFLCCLLPVYLHYFPPTHWLPTRNDFLWLLVLAWLCSVVAFQFSTGVLKKLSAFTVNLTYNLEPLYGIILAFLVYHEDKLLSKWFYVGFLIIGLSLVFHVYMLVRQEKKQLDEKTVPVAD